MKRGINPLSEHCIICAAGRVGTSAAREPERKPVPFSRPHLVRSLNTVTTHLGVGLEIDAVLISAASHLVGKTMEGSRIGQPRGAIVLAITRPNGRRFNLALEDPIEAGDLLFAMGEPREFRRLEQLATS